MTRFIHDAYTMSYSVHHNERRIVLNVVYPFDPFKGYETKITFHEVVGYRFYGDAFGNIVFDVAEWPLDDFLSKCREFMKEEHRMHGAFGQWADTAESALGYFTSSGMKVFELSSSLGLTGWVIAQKIDYIQPDA